MLAILAAYHKLPSSASSDNSNILKADVAAFAAKAEQYVGVSCGGMDQVCYECGVGDVCVVDIFAASTIINPRCPQAISIMGMKDVAQLVFTLCPHFHPNPATLAAPRPSP